MTRKRFVKMLMAEGYSRNDANKKASIVGERGFGYKRAYQIALFGMHLEKVGVASAKMTEAMLLAIHGLKNMATNAVKAARSFEYLGKTTSISMVDELEVNNE